MKVAFCRVPLHSFTETVLLKVKPEVSDSFFALPHYVGLQEKEEGNFCMRDFSKMLIIHCFS